MNRYNEEKSNDDYFQKKGLHVSFKKVHVPHSVARVTCHGVGRGGLS